MPTYKEVTEAIKSSKSKDEYYSLIIEHRNTILNQLIYKKHWEIAKDLDMTPATISSVINMLKALTNIEHPITYLGLSHKDNIDDLNTSLDSISQTSSLETL